MPDCEITLEAKVAFLRQSSAFAELTGRVEAIETHMSWVFLTDTHAWKLKKPVCHDVLDFSTIEARHFYCTEEVRLNRRLTLDVYLGVMRLSCDEAGHLQLEGQGAVVDWLVKMRRLPTYLMFDHALRQGTAHALDIGRIGTRLANFYKTCVPVEIATSIYRARFLNDIDAQSAELCRPEHRLPLDQVRRVACAQRRVLGDQAALFDARVRAGRIVEGHGDLRPEHVCLDASINIIDCLEFSRDLRTVDAADEFGFLALECERLGAAEAGEMLLRIYNELSGDPPPPALIHFYQSYRASLRAAIAIRHLNEEKFRASPEWRRRALDYLRLAERHVARCQITPATR